MIVAAITAGLGLTAPWIVRRVAHLGTAPRLTVNAQLAGLVLTWGGLLAVVSEALAPNRGLVAACDVLLASLLRGQGPTAGIAAIGAYVLLPGRGLRSLVQTVAAATAAARRLQREGTEEGRLTVVADLGTVAVTAGLLRPIIVVDQEEFAQLTAQERAIVIAHEEGHRQQRHALVELAAHALAAGLAPWPGASLALREIRRHLEAAADDRAARSFGARRVGFALASVATRSVAPAGPGLLGADGWSLWRVQRLLGDQQSRVGRLLMGCLVVAVALVLGGQGTAHALTGAHLTPVDAVCPA